MAEDYSERSVVIDDFIGGKEGREIIDELRKDLFAQIVIHGCIPLDIGIIREGIIKKLGNKKYDLMLFVETGGVYFLGIPEITKHAKQIAVLPLSAHANPILAQLGEICAQSIIDLKEAILKSNSIAIVEGDVGRRGCSFSKIKALRKEIRQLNKEVTIDVIVGVVVRDYSKVKLFSIIGVVAFNLVRLSDVVHDVEEKHYSAEVHDSKVIKKLLKYWRHRKTLPVVVKK